MTEANATEISRTTQLDALTDAQHQELHRLVAVGNPFANRENFATWVEVQYRFQGMVADLYQHPTLKSLLPDLENRSRLDATRADLQDLGKTLAPLEEPIKVEDITTAQALGWLYVSEGSTLGAAILLNKAIKCLDLSAEFGARHLAASPEGRARHWKAFTELVNNQPMQAEEERQLGEAAQVAFSYFAVELRKAYGIPS